MVPAGPSPCPAGKHPHAGPRCPLPELKGARLGARSSRESEIFGRRGEAQTLGFDGEQACPLQTPRLRTLPRVRLNVNVNA